MLINIGYILAMVAMALYLSHSYELPAKVHSMLRASLFNMLPTSKTPAVTETHSDTVNDPLAGHNDAEFVRQYKCDHEHKYRMSVIKRKPMLMYITDFMTDGEAQHLIAIGMPSLAESTVVGANSSYKHPGRTSRNSFLRRHHDAVVTCIEQRASSLVNLPVVNIEPLQVVAYSEGQKYDPHFDYFAPDAEGAARETLRGGQRVVTIFAYLNTLDLAKHGGGTQFPVINVTVPAVRGDAAFWYDTNEDGAEEPLTSHGGMAVRGDAEKFGLNIWIREGEFN